MRKLMSMVGVLALVVGMGSVRADDTKEVTLKGTLLCAKCELKETSKCQNALKVTEGDKSTIYYLADNATSKDKHSDVCKAPVENVTVTGTVEEKDGKQVITASKVEMPAK